MPSNLKELLEWVPEIDDLATATRAAAKNHANSADFYNALTNTSTWEGSAGDAARAASAMTADQHDKAAQNLTLGALGMAHAQHQADILANKIRDLNRYADEQPAIEVDLETNKASLPASYDYLDEEAQAKIDTKMTVLEEQIPKLLAEGQQVDTELSHAIAAATGLPEPEADHGDPGSGAGDPQPSLPKRVPGPHPGDPPYATGQTPTLAGDPHDVPPMKVDPGSSATVQLTDNPPGYTGPAGPQRDAAWLAYLSQQDGTSPGTVSPNMVLPNPEAVSNPGLKTVGAAARQQGVSYAWGAGHPDKAAVPGVTTGTLAGDPENGRAHLYGDDNRTGFDCSGLSRFATYEGHGGLDISKENAGNTGGQYTWLTSTGAGTAVLDNADLKPGDLLYFGASGAGSDHVAVYAGNGLMIEAAQSGVPIEVSPIRGGHFNVHVNS